MGRGAVSKHVALSRGDILHSLVGKRVGVVLINGQAIGGVVVQVAGGIIHFEQRGKRAWAVVEHVIAWEQMDVDEEPAVTLAG